MKIFKLFVIAFFAIFLLNSCDDNPIAADAELSSIDEIATKPGFTWFYEEMNKYIPDEGVVELIKGSYNQDEHDFYLFVKPSCTCPGNHNLFPKFIKTLESAGITESEYTIYTMTSEDNKHPFEDIMAINELPAFMIFKNGSPVYSLGDTLALDVLKDQEKKIEEYILTAILK